MRADLHIHTIYSDGVCTPAEIAERAVAVGLGLISMTDHDSMEGTSEKRAAAERLGLSFVSGWEVSAYVGTAQVHVLGYNCEAGEAYRNFSLERRRGALVRAQDMIEKANAYFGLGVTIEEVEKKHLKKETPLHTMHVVDTFAELLKMGRGEVYRQYFANGKVAFSGLCRPTPEDALEVVHASGGLAVLAHPARIGLEPARRAELMDSLVERGLDGIECTYTSHTESETEFFKRYARAHGLLQTGGSDFHQDGTSRILGQPEFYPSERLLAALGLPY